MEQLALCISYAIIGRNAKIATVEIQIRQAETQAWMLWTQEALVNLITRVVTFPSAEQALCKAIL